MNRFTWLILWACLSVLGSFKICYATNIMGRGGNCLDVASGGTANGTNVQMWQCQTGNHNQDWTFDNGRIIWSGTNKCLDVSGGGTKNGTNVQIWDCQAGNLNQRWALNVNFPGKIVWAGGKCIDVSGGGTVNGTNAQIWDCMTGNDNQQWIIGTSTACIPPTKQNLAVTLRPQETSMWCWAASGQMTMEYLGHKVSQCVQANNRFSRNDCCNTPTPNDCVKGGWPEFAKYKFASQHTSNAALSWDQICRELADANSCGRRAFAFTWAWPGGSGHMMAAIGYQTIDNVNYVEINDPWSPNVGDHRFITYDFYVQSPGHHTHWDDYYEIRYTGGN